MTRRTCARCGGSWWPEDVLAHRLIAGDPILCSACLAILHDAADHDTTACGSARHRGTCPDCGEERPDCCTECGCCRACGPCTAEAQVLS